MFICVFFITTKPESALEGVDRKSVPIDLKLFKAWYSLGLVSQFISCNDNNIAYQIPTGQDTFSTVLNDERR